MKRSALLLCVLALVAACGGESPTVPDADPSPLLKKVETSDGPSGTDAAAIQAFEAAGMSGAVVDHDQCFIVGPGFFNENGDLIGFGGLFPDPCPQGFARTNPDGTTDNHMSGKGYFFLFLFQPFAIFGSDGSDVRWTWKSHEDGGSILNIHGTLSDGSRVRAHFNTSQGNGEGPRSGRLWVQGLGYILGEPGS